VVNTGDCNSCWSALEHRIRIIPRPEYAPSLHATRAETRLTVYRAHHMSREWRLFFQNLRRDRSQAWVFLQTSRFPNLNLHAAVSTSSFSYTNFRLRTPTAVRESRKHRNTSSERTILENDAHSENLGRSRFQAVEFSWTSRFQNLKLHDLILILDDPQQNRPSGSRDIFVFVKTFGARGKPPTIVYRAG